MQSQIHFPWIRFEAYFSYPLARFMSGLCIRASQRELPRAVDGVLDLSDWDFAQDGLVPLQGEWLFAWNALIEPIPFQQFRDRYPEVIDATTRWTKYPDATNTGALLGDYGFATYAMHIRLPQSYDPKSFLGFETGEAMSAATWRVVSADGQFEYLAYRHGDVGRSASTSLPAFSAKETDYFRVLPSENSLTVFVQVSNFTRKRGGLAWAPVLGTRSQVQRASKTALAYDGITFGVLFIGFLFHLVIFWQRRDDYASLFWFYVWHSILACTHHDTAFDRNRGVGGDRGEL